MSSSGPSFKILVIHQMEGYSEQIRYAFDLLLNLALLKCELRVCGPSDKYDPLKWDLLIFYGAQFSPETSEKSIHIISSQRFFPGFLKKNSLPLSALRRYGSLPMIYAGGDPERDLFVEQKGNGIITNMDIVASTFFLATRYEEFLTPNGSGGGRFQGGGSIELRENFWDMPVVHEYALLLESWMRRLHSQLETWRVTLWGGRKAAVCLTHDVDYYRKAALSLFLAKMTSEVFRHRNWARSLVHFTDFLRTYAGLKKDSYLTFDRLLEMEQGMRTTYFFLSSKTERWYSNYKLKGEVISLIRKLEDLECEVGLHASSRAYNCLSALKKEKDLLQKLCANKNLGVRNHQLRWDPKISWRIQTDLGLLYDSTLTFPQTGGFRGGICHPYKSFDLDRQAKMNLWELPLTLMDATLFAPEYLGLEPQKACAEIDKYLDTIEKYSGMFIMLWHNSSFDRIDCPNWAKAYEHLIQSVRERGYLVDTCRNLVEIYCNTMAHMAE